MKHIKCPVHEYARRSPQSVAVRSGLSEITYGELDKNISDTVIKLRDRGVCPDMNVVVALQNCPKYIILIFSILRIGATVIPVNFRFPVDRIKRIIEQTEALLIVSDDNRGYGIDHLILEELFTGKKAENSEREENPLISGETVILTSGTTGNIKGVILSAENHYFSALGSNENILLGNNDRWLLILPLFHVGGFAILFRVFLAGASVVLREKRKVGIGSLIQKTDVSHVSMVSTQLLEFTDFLEKRKIDSPEALKVVLTGGGVISESLLLRAVKRNVPVFKTYGMTEMSSQVTTTGGIVPSGKLLTSGSVLRYREISIGEGDSILVRGETLFSGYLTEKGFVPVTLNGDGWFDTGDIGFVDDSGYLFVTGRKDNMFVSGGENIFPEEIERELEKIDHVSEAVVVAVLDKKYGKRPVAFINTGGIALKKKRIVGKLKEVFPKFKIPDVFYYLDENKNSLKRDRTLLRELIGKGDDGFEKVSD